MYNMIYAVVQWREVASSVDEELGEMTALSDRSTAAPNTLRGASPSAFYPALRSPSYYDDEPTLDEIRQLLLSPIPSHRQEGLALLKRIASRALAQIATATREGGKDKAEKKATIKILMHRLDLLCNTDLACARAGNAANGEMRGPQETMEGPLGAVLAKETEEKTLVITTQTDGERIITTRNPHPRNKVSHNE